MGKTADQLKQEMEDKLTAESGEPASEAANERPPQPEELNPNDLPTVQPVEHPADTLKAQDSVLPSSSEEVASHS